MKKYEIKKNKKLLKQLKPFWHKLRALQRDFFTQVHILESEMEIKTKINGIEFFMNDGEFIGIGNEKRTMELIHDTEIEEGKTMKI